MQWISVSEAVKKKDLRRIFILQKSQLSHSIAQ